jgi:hypothetical protein
MHLLHRVGEVGVDADAVHVGHDQQRRVFERDAILQELRKGFVEVLSRPLIFPGEMALAPDIGPTIAATRLVGPFLEREPFPFGVGGHRIEHAQQGAQIVEMTL